MTQNTFGNQRFVVARNAPRGHQIDLKVPACLVTDGQQSYERQGSATYSPFYTLKKAHISFYSILFNCLSFYIYIHRLLILFTHNIIFKTEESINQK
jgi:hypothetical protein